jgi:hypothetical protein
MITAVAGGLGMAEAVSWGGGSVYPTRRLEEVAAVAGIVTGAGTVTAVAGRATVAGLLRPCKSMTSSLESGRVGDDGRDGMTAGLFSCLGDMSERMVSTSCQSQG